MTEELSPLFGSQLTPRPRDVVPAVENPVGPDENPAFQWRAIRVLEDDDPSCHAPSLLESLARVGTVMQDEGEQRDIEFASFKWKMSAIVEVKREP